MTPAPAPRALSLRVRARARVHLPQLPELNRIKQSLHMSQVSCARMANDALLCGWDPELEFDIQQLLTLEREVTSEEAEIGAYDDAYEGELGIGINLNRRYEPSTPATPSMYSRSEPSTPAPMDVDEDKTSRGASGRAVCSLDFH